MSKKDRTTKEYDLITKKPEKQVQPKEIDGPSPIISSTQPKVRSVIHDVLSSETIPSAKVLINRGGDISRPKGMYISVPINLFGYSSGPNEDLLIDMEWYSILAYPKPMVQYYLSSYDFDYRPKRIFDESDEFLRKAYKFLEVSNLNISFGHQLRTTFNELRKEDTNGKPLYPINQSAEIRNHYLLLAYSMTRLLFEKKATIPLRNYTQMTYPGVIAASYVLRSYGFYKVILDTLKIDKFSEKARKKEKVKKPIGFNNIPSITAHLSREALFVTGRNETVSNYAKHDYFALQNLVLNIPDIDQQTIDERIKLPFPEDPEKVNMRCNYYIQLINERKYKVGT